MSLGVDWCGEFVVGDVFGDFYGIVWFVVQLVQQVFVDYLCGGDGDYQDYCIIQDYQLQ